jgi:uncharacterized protein
MRELSEQFAVGIRVHINARNWRDIPSFVETLDSDFGGDRRFALHLVPVEAYATGASSSFSDCAERQNVHECIARSLQQARNIEILNTPEDSCNICYAAKGNAYVIRSDGIVMKCTVAVYDPINHIGKIDDDGSLNIDKSKFLWWMEGFKTQDYAQLACPYGRAAR